MLSRSPDAPRGRVLLVEDDPSLARLTSTLLSSLGHEVEVAMEGAGVVDRVREAPPDCLILDVELPGETGLSICRRVRAFYDGPILMLTGRNTGMDEVIARELGADDYVVKPADPRMLALRLESLLRLSRRSGAETPGGYADQDLRLDPAARSVVVRGQAVDLSTAEYELVAYLIDHIGQPVSREMYWQDVRGVPWDGMDRALDIRMSQVRKKLVAAGLPEDRIKTVRGTGYQLTPA